MPFPFRIWICPQDVFFVCRDPKRSTCTKDHQWVLNSFFFNVSIVFPWEQQLNFKIPICKSVVKTLNWDLYFIFYWNSIEIHLKSHLFDQNNNLNSANPFDRILWQKCRQKREREKNLRKEISKNFGEMIFMFRQFLKVWQIKTNFFIFLELNVFLFLENILN